MTPAPFLKRKSTWPKNGETPILIEDRGSLWWAIVNGLCGMVNPTCRSFYVDHSKLGLTWQVSPPLLLSGFLTSYSKRISSIASLTGDLRSCRYLATLPLCPALGSSCIPPLLLNRCCHTAGQIEFSMINLIL